MDFRLDDEQLALRDTVRAFCAATYPRTGLPDREGAPVAPTEWRQLADLGVLSLLVPEGEGGPGLGLVEAAVVFEQLGVHLVPGPVLWSTLGAPVLPGPPGTVRVGGVDQGGSGDGVALVEHPLDVDVLLVLRDEGLFAVDRAQLPDPELLESFDPLTPVGTFGQLPAGTLVGGPARRERTRAEGTVLAAAMLVGIAEAALQVATGHAAEREQFGQPIGAFQAVKHLLADMFVRTALARSATYAAAAVVDDPSVGHATRSVRAAKLLAGEAAIDNARAAVQVLGGMGFTWAMPPHFLLKRAWLLEHSFGTSASHAAAIGASLAADPA